MKQKQITLGLSILGLVIGQVACNPALPVEPQQSVAQQETATPTARPEPTATSPPATATTPPDEVLVEEEAISVIPTGNPDLEYAQVTFVKATQGSNGLWRFDVTVRHNDQGWDNYADAWQVIDLEGNLLGKRILLHPHDTEQPFTRSQSNIEISPDISQVIVQAKDNVEGFGGQVVVVDLTLAAGENFEVVRNEP